MCTYTTRAQQCQHGPLMFASSRKDEAEMNATLPLVSGENASRYYNEKSERSESYLTLWKQGLVWFQNCFRRCIRHRQVAEISDLVPGGGLAKLINTPTTGNSSWSCFGRGL